MKKHAVIFVAATALLTTLGTGIFAASQQQTLKGEYYSDGDEGGDLEAVFTPAGEDRWSVDFHFTFQGQPHVFSGTARGNLVDGELEGTVRTEDQRGTFTFRGAFADGVFYGTHAQLVEDGREQKTGTLTLRR